MTASLGSLFQCFTTPSVKFILSIQSKPPLHSWINHIPSPSGYVISHTGHDAAGPSWPPEHTSGTCPAHCTKHCTITCNPFCTQLCREAVTTFTSQSPSQRPPSRSKLRAKRRRETKYAYPASPLRSYFSQSTAQPTRAPSPPSAPRGAPRSRSAAAVPPRPEAGAGPDGGWQAGAHGAPHPAAKRGRAGRRQHASSRRRGAAWQLRPVPQQPTARRAGNGTERNGTGTARCTSAASSATAQPQPLVPPQEGPARLSPTGVTEPEAATAVIITGMSGRVRAAGPGKAKQRETG